MSLLGRMTGSRFVQLLCWPLWIGLGLVLWPEAGRVLAQPLEPVTLQLKWHHQFQFAGYYAALAQGYYRDAGLDVRIVPAAAGVDAVVEVSAGRAQYGVSNSALVVARAQGRPVVVLAAIFQHTPIVLLARPQAGIRHVQDLRGKRAMIEPLDAEVFAYLQQQGVPRSSLHLVPHSFNLADFTQGRVDVISAYSTNEPFYLEQAGQPYLSFTPRQGRIDFYGDNLFTSEQELREHPDRVARFRAASLRGWNYAMAHPDAIIDLILTHYNSQSSRAHLQFEARQMAPLVQPELVGMGYMHPERWRHIVDIYREFGLLRGPFDVQAFVYDPDLPLRQERDHLLWALVLLFALGTVLAGVAIFLLRLARRLRQEVAIREAMTAHLAENERQFRFMAEHSADVIWTLDLSNHCLSYISPAVTALCGHEPQHLLGHPIMACMTPASASHFATVLAAFTQEWPLQGEEVKCVVELELYHADGRVLVTETVLTPHSHAEGQLLSLLGVTRDISERKKTEAVIRDLALYDELTKLPNRHCLNERLTQALAASKRSALYGALMFLDLDNFKPLNDTHGHGVGDQLLQEVARRLERCVREVDTVARFGGDEFVVLLTGLGPLKEQAQAQAQAVAEKIRASLAEPYVLPTMDSGAETMVTHRCTSSIGVVLFLGDAVSEQALCRWADGAMYEAKAEGRNAVHFWVLAH